MDGLFRESASGRRRFLDRLVYGFDPEHSARCNAYEHALRERARLLKGGQGDAAWLASLEDSLATRGVAIAAARLAMEERLQRACDERSEEHTSELQSLMRSSYAVFCL